MDKKFMAGVYMDLHFIAEKRDNGSYYCIPKYSKGNGTQMDFFKDNPKAKFYDTLDEALGNKKSHNNRLAAMREDRLIIAGKLRYL